MYQAPTGQSPASALNQGQQEAADGFFEFLFDDEAKEYNISGPGGVGKTFLMGQLIDHVIARYEETCRLMGIEPRYTEVHMTATTNKAAEVLSQQTNRPTSTIHSFLGLKMRDDYSTGRQILTKGKGWQVHENKIIFIDECSMIDSSLYYLIHDGTMNCKIVYVGDQCQLAPVLETISPVYRNKMPLAELTENVRVQQAGNGEKPALLSLNEQLRETVQTGVFKPIVTVPGVIDLLDVDEMEARIDEVFSNQVSHTRILAWSNDRVLQYNDHIRQLRQLPPELTPGERVVNNKAIPLQGQMLSVEQEFLIKDIANTRYTLVIEDPQGGDDFSISYRTCTLETTNGGVIDEVPLIDDRDHLRDVTKYLARLKKWGPYYDLQRTFPDLRMRDACTVHKSQGSTYDFVFIDLGDISRCNNPDQVARMLYVAASRARIRVYLFGELAEKYGGVIA